MNLNLLFLELLNICPFVQFQFGLYINFVKLTLIPNLCNQLWPNGRIVEEPERP